MVNNHAPSSIPPSGWFFSQMKVDKITANQPAMTCGAGICEAS
jgi:hypothetical protein